MNVEGIEFPDSPLWMVNPDRTNEIGEDLLAVAYGALVQQQRFGVDVNAEQYERQFVGHGTRLAVPPARSNQLTVYLVKVQGGRAGEELFTFLKGEPAKLGYQTAHYSVELSRPWPKRTDATPIRTDQIGELRPPLWRDGLIVWSAFVALTLGGVRAPHVGAAEIAVGPMVPRDPNGGVASWVVDVQVQL